MPHRRPANGSTATLTHQTRATQVQPVPSEAAALGGRPDMPPIGFHPHPRRAGRTHTRQPARRRSGHATALRHLLAVLAALAGLLGTAAPPAAAADTPAPFTLTADLHDGMIAQFGSAYYLYGTAYGCGFTWSRSGTPWCGFGAARADDRQGPYASPTPLFNPTDIDPYTGHDFRWLCGSTGQGCFNPRMIQRTGWGANDGAYLLWFNAPKAFADGATSAYYVMGCNSPTGPCGTTAGPPYGSTHRPTLHQCAGADGDFTLTNDQTGAAVLCTHAGPTMSLAIERLTSWGSDGTDTGATNLANLTHVESPGIYHDAASNTWITTYSDPNCGYCTGTGTGYATAPALLGPWNAPANVGINPPPTGRRDLSATSCGGQPRTISHLDGQPWQGIDLWTGTLNQTSARQHYEPLHYTPTTVVAGDAQPWKPPFTPFSCT